MAEEFNIPIQLTCSECGLPLINAIKTKCEHRHCAYCLTYKTKLPKSNTSTCPQCGIKCALQFDPETDAQIALMFTMASLDLQKERKKIIKQRRREEARYLYKWNEHLIKGFEQKGKGQQQILS